MTLCLSYESALTMTSRSRDYETEIATLKNLIREQDAIIQWQARIIKQLTSTKGLCVTFGDGAESALGRNDER